MHQYEYQEAISELYKNEWLHRNKNLNVRIERLIAHIEAMNVNLDALDDLTVKLLDIHTDAKEPSIFRLLQNNTFEEKSEDDEVFDLFRALGQEPVKELEDNGRIESVEVPPAA